MIEVKKEGVLLTKTDLEFENDGVLNPAAIREGDSVHLLYRAVRKGNYSSIGYCRLEETHVNLNQGAESTISYLLARFTLEKYKNEKT